jgi:hypothetical protein
VGLVYVAPNNGPDKLYDLLPVQREVHPRRTGGEWQMKQPHLITTGVPFEELPKTDYAEFQAKIEPLATVGPHPLVVAQDGPGQGRVVVWTYNTGWQGSGNYKCGLTPWLRNAGQKFKYWEYHFSLLIKSLLWAARREPDVALPSIRVDTAGPSPQLTVRVDNPRALLPVTAEVKVSDAYGVVEREEAWQVRVEKGESSLDFQLPDHLPGGLHLADVILKSQGRVVNWGSAAFRLDRGLAISKVAFDQKAYRPGETATVTCEWERGRGGEGERERARDQPAEDVLLRTEFSFPLCTSSAKRLLSSVFSSPLRAWAEVQ